jgi:murein DD-endopeptidase MepM/ murein hydrolase activator NlpD
VNDLWLIAVLALCLPVLLFSLAFSPKLGGPSQALDLQAITTVYEVRPGDTLSAIASRHGLPLSWLMVSNNLTSTAIHPGQKLLIPKGGIVHTVKPGETLRAIARAYGVSAEALREANGLREEPAPGTRVFVPAPKTVPSIAPEDAPRFVWPVKGPISSPFGPRIHPVYGIPSFHNGIDLAVPEGTPVRAAMAGVVSFAGWEGGFGLLVVLDHQNGYETYYAHLSRILVRVGQRVSAGETIALSGNTGLSTGPHLHFEVRYLGSPVDPRPLLP